MATRNGSLFTYSHIAGKSGPAQHSVIIERAGTLYELIAEEKKQIEVFSDTRQLIGRPFEAHCDTLLGVGRHLDLYFDTRASITRRIERNCDTRIVVIKVFRPYKEQTDMALGLITNSGRILTAKLLMGDGVDGITHCAIGDGDATFIDPANPPVPVVSQTTLKHELARKKVKSVEFLREDPEGEIVVGGVRFIKTEAETPIIGLFFDFDESQANGVTIREYGFFGGDVEYIAGHTSDYATGGIYSSDNPNGQVRKPGYLYEIKHTPDFPKCADTRVEIIAVIKI